MYGIRFDAVCACVGLAVAACGADGAQGDDGDDQAEMQALLHDQPLTGPAGIRRGTRAAIEQPPALLPERIWRFNDCSPDRAELFNFGGGEIAYRSVGVSCTQGILGAAVALAAKEDIVYVPDEPYFTFGGGVSVAGWFQPVDVERTQTMFRKRDTGTSAFALVLHRGRFRFVINLGGGKAASVTAPARARAGVFQHVAASYDGAALRLYVDGEQVAVRNVAGAIPPGPGPLLIGNDGSERRFDGTIDEAAFVLRAMSPVQIRQLTCFPVEPTVVATPEVSPPTPPDVATTFDIAVTNNNPQACVPMEFDLIVRDAPGLTIDPRSPSFHSPPVASGETTHFTFALTPIDATEGGPVEVDYDLSAFEWFYSFLGAIHVDVTEPPGCHVSKFRELLITHPAVTQDPIRTHAQGPAGDPRVGAWTFKHLVEEMAPAPADAPAMVEDMLRTLLTTQTINGFEVPPRPGLQRILDAWPRTPDGGLDLARAPLVLKAIVNRIDLRNLDEGNAGQGSFVFAYVQDRFELSATLMLEYKLPAETEADVLSWAQAFHALAALPVFSESHNAALQAITDRFVGRGVRPGGVNGSALHAVRSNEFSFGEVFNFEYDLREFRLSPTTGRLVPVALDRTPDLNLNFSFALSDYVAANRDAILAGTHTVPDQFQGLPFRAGAIRNGGDQVWTTSIPEADAETRHAFAINTCNGCHSPDETGTFFQHLSSFELSPFLIGVTVDDPISHAPRSYNDLLRRRLDLEAIVCPAEPTVSLRHGISRVH